jgi:carbon monoxide dehydrogenase subunit G
MLLASVVLANAGISMAASATDLANANVSQPRSGRAALPSTVEVRVEQQGDRIVVHAQSDVAADRSTIWATLTDYDNLARFIPEMSSSRMMARNGTVALVEQRGVARVGPLRRSFSVVLQVSEHADESINLAGVGGDFKLFDARYQIVSLTADRSRIVYDAAIVPLTPTPSLMGVPIMRTMIGTQFGALVQEMSRRASANAALTSSN